MKLPEYGNQPNYFQWLVMNELTRDYASFEVALCNANLNTGALIEHVESIVFEGIAEDSLAADLLRFVMSLIDFERLSRDLREIQP